MNEVSKGYQSTGQGTGGAVATRANPLLDAHVRERLLCNATEALAKGHKADVSVYVADWDALRHEQERTQELVKELTDRLHPFISEDVPGLDCADIDTESTVPVLRAIRMARALQSDINHALHVLQARIPH